MDKILNTDVFVEIDTNLDQGMGVLTLNHLSYLHTQIKVPWIETGWVLEARWAEVAAFEYKVPKYSSIQDKLWKIFEMEVPKHFSQLGWSLKFNQETTVTINKQ